MNIHNEICISIVNPLPVRISIVSYTRYIVRYVSEIYIHTHSFIIHRAKISIAMIEMEQGSETTGGVQFLRSKFHRQPTEETSTKEGSGIIPTRY